MTRRLHGNSVSTTLLYPITASDLSFTVVSATGFPAIGSNETFRVTFSKNGLKEVLIVTDDTSTPAFTCTRAAEGTSAQAWPAGTLIEIRTTADSHDRKQDQIATSGDVIDFGDATSFEIPNNATATLSAAGQIALDTSVTDYADGVLCYRAGSTDYGVIAIPKSDLASPSNNYTVTYDAGTDKFKLAAGGSGDVAGPSSATDNAIARFDTTTGKLLQDSGAILEDNGNMSSNNYSAAYTTTATAAGTTVLTVASTQQQFFTGSTTQTVTLPVTSTLPRLGYQFRVVNNSSGVVTVQSSGANSIQAMAANTSAIFTCILLSGTTAASWSVAYFSAAGGGGTPGGSTTQVQYNSSGSFAGDSGFTYAGSGTATLSTQLTVGTLQLSTNTLTGTASNTDVTITANGTGGYVFSGTKAAKMPVGTTAQRPTAANGMIRYNTDLARTEAALGNSWTGAQLLCDGDFSSTGLMQRTGTGTYAVLSIPLTVANGGTGRTTSTTAYGVICAGTTATAAHQTVSGVGTSGQVLTSQGAGALPTWTTVAALTDGDYGDVTVSASGTQITVDLPASATVATDDKVYIFDTSSSNAKKYVTAQSIADLALGAKFSDTYFLAQRTTTQSVNTATFTKVQLATEAADVAGTFDNATNYRHTPTTAGYYLYMGLVAIAIDDQKQLYTAVYKNGSAALTGIQYMSAASQTTLYVAAQGVLYMNGTTDYVELYCYHNYGSSSNITADGSKTYLLGGLLI